MSAQNNRVNDSFGLMIIDLYNYVMEIYVVLIFHNRLLSIFYLLNINCRYIDLLVED